jgi:hypothetical protein
MAVLGIMAMCCKVLLSVLNFTMAIAGIALMTIGGIVLNNVRGYDEIDNYTTGAIVIVCIGAVLTLVSIFGCFGTMKESACMLQMFSAFLVLLLIASVAVMSSVSTIRSQIITLTSYPIQNLVSNYIFVNGSSSQEWSAMDTIQSSFECCGARNVSDWKFQVPSSCCVDQSFCSGKPSSIDQYFEEGCVSKFAEWGMAQTNRILVASFVVIGLELLGLLFAGILIYIILNEKYKPV